VNQLSRNLALWLLLILMVLLLVNVFTKQPLHDQEMIFSDFLAAVDKGEVSEVTIQGQDIHGKRASGESFRTFSPAYPELITDLRAKGVKIDARREDPEPFWYVLLVNWFPMILLIGLWVFFMRQMQVGGGKAMSFGKSKAKLLNVELVDLSTLLRESDYVSLHVVITPETYHMIGEAELRQMKPTAYLINTSRGEAIDEAALVKAVQENWIAGAALDVFEPEPLSAESLLRTLDPMKVFLTPHNIAHTPDSRDASLAMTLRTALTVGRGERPESMVNPEVLPRWRARVSVAG